MPEPFRLFAPPPVITEKLLLVDSDTLHLALSMTQVKQVLLNVPVTRQQENAPSLVNFQDLQVPVLLGHRPCPPLQQAIIVLFQTPVLKTGLIGIACSNLPVMSPITDKDWLVVTETLPTPWQTDGKAYRHQGTTYIHVVGLKIKA
jgi:hypothetical protein